MAHCENQERAVRSREWTHSFRRLVKFNEWLSAAGSDIVNLSLTISSHGSPAADRVQAPRRLKRSSAPSQNCAADIFEPITGRGVNIFTPENKTQKQKKGRRKCRRVLTCSERDVETPWRDVRYTRDVTVWAGYDAAEQLGSTLTKYEGVHMRWEGQKWREGLLEDKKGKPQALNTCSYTPASPPRTRQNPTFLPLAR